MNTLPSAKTYTALRAEIAEILEQGKERARRAVEQERVRTYWEIGQALHAHFLANKERADYGDQLVERLSDELGLGQRLLYQMIEVYRAFPILQTSTKLSWSHYPLLATLPNRELRRQYMLAAIERGWSVRQLREELRAGTPPSQIGPEESETNAQLLRPRRGQLYRYRVVENAVGELVLDLGFGVYRRADWLGVEGVRKGVVIEAKRARDGAYSLVVLPGRAQPYTYGAEVVRVVDGDTLWVEIDCGFDVWVKQKLRLRGIDCPELGTPEGRWAQAFVEEMLATSRVVLCTSRADKYDRYLADVFYGAEAEASSHILEKGAYLNRQLLQEGLAARFEG